VTQIGTVLAGRYQLGDRIAVGGAGEVWRAVDVMLDRPVAVKLLRAEFAQHPETLVRFRSEARHAASLTHPGIAQIFDYYDSGIDHLPFLVMELVDGPSLADVLTGGPLDPADAMDIVAQAAAGLEAAHRSGLVHRDIKPANLLLTPGGVVKITDFGIAHAAGSAPVTRQGTLIGTPAYLAPERVAGEPATPASDLYSLGILAHECLTGTRPYAGTSTEIALAHGQRALPPLPSHIPPAVAAFVADLTARDPADRPASGRLVSARAAALRDDLTAARRSRHGAPYQDVIPDTTAIQHPLTLADMNPLWHADPTGERTPDAQPSYRGWSRRRVMLAVGAASIAAGLIGWGVSSATTPSQARTPATPPAAATSHSAAMVTVQADALIGQPANAVYQQLQNLGLRPVIVWQQSGDQSNGYNQPSGYNQSPGFSQDGYSQSSGQGTVVSIDPSGPVPVGSVVTVTAVPKHHGGDGQSFGGDGNGNGGGNKAPGSGAARWRRIVVG
jgi:serine/threonine protein kinase